MADRRANSTVAAWWPAPAGGVDLGAVGVAAGLASLATVLGWRGSDLPAQLLRAHLFELHGFTPWNSLWFGGHATAGYSVLFPAAAAFVGVGGVGVASCVGAAACAGVVARLRSDRPSRLAALWFAAGTVANLAVGRVTFAFGLALACGALASLLYRRTVPAVVLAALTSLASPVAGVGLIVVAATVVLGDGRERKLAFPWLAIGLAAATPLVALAAAFPSSGSGSFPFTTGAVVANLLVCCSVYFLAPRTARAVRTGALVYGAACLVVAAVPNPLGGNISRIGMHAAGPLLIAVAAGPRRRLLCIVLPALVWWQWSPALDAMSRAGRDPSTHGAYHQPLIDELLGAEAIGRVEVVPTKRHWETYYVASEVPLARGWERQTDRAWNPLFYDGTLTSSSYHRWLVDNAVRWVALPDVALDDAGRAEAALLASPPSYLRLAWSNEHWQLWEVVGAGAAEVVVGPGRVVAWGSSSVTLEVTAPGSVLVRVHASPHWHLVGGREATSACTREGEGGWLEVEASRAGILELQLSIGGAPSRC